MRLKIRENLRTISLNTEFPVDSYIKKSITDIALQ